ncbi:BspA family leucine-rich repeat surface protein [Lactobacillus sp. YT155]|uniref:BspA family leucine-rich repeat surface protein n=1 Tax=Lactobacillus sp. YT155 TaxID=3060955 RepID=UPI00265F7CA6|nr:BspA family leucine-rich repeat surface protein [Lactobacillus sp. YT155]MDO1605890.1 BspA family leucine-rich repeat surface protein [Lactobacillus sp. YT155]
MRKKGNYINLWALLKYLLIFLTVTSQFMMTYNTYVQASEQSIGSSQKGKLKPQASDIANGTIGTSSWRIDDQGILYIGPGVMPNSNASDNMRPFKDYADKINKIVITDKLVAGDLVVMFQGLNKVTTIDGMLNLDTSRVRNMYGMFQNMTSLKTLDLSGFDTSNVTSMANMFSEDRALTSVDVSNFDTSNVTNMANMFLNNPSLTSVDVSGFDTSNVTAFQAMFAYDNSLTSIDVSNFDTSKATSMGSMFLGNDSLKSVDVSNFDTSNVTDFSAMFAYDASLKSIDVSSFDTSKATNMNTMFYYMKKLETLDLSGFDTKNVTSINGMLQNNNVLRQLKLGKKFKFRDTTASLPEIVRNSVNTGKWINLGDGEADTPRGSNIWSSAELMKNYDGSKDADTYVWQTVGKNITVRYVDESGKTLCEDVVLSGNVGENYSTEQKKFAGYEFKEVQGGEAEGKFSNQELVITYIYSKKASQIKVHNSIIYTGDSWKPQDNWDQTIDENDESVSFEEFQRNGLIKGNVDTNRIGEYKIQYRYHGVTAEATVTVLQNQQILTGSNLVKYVGDTLPNDSEFKALARDKKGQTTGVHFDKTKINMNEAGRYDVLLTSDDGQIKTVTVEVKDNQQKVTGQDVTKYVGDKMPADSEFKASATDKTGEEVAVSIDKSQVNMTQAGDYNVELKTADHQTKLVKVHVKADQRKIQAQDVTIKVGSKMPADSEFAAKATDKDGKNLLLTIDKSKVNVNQIGDYEVLIKASDGQTKTVKVHVKKEQQQIDKKSTVIVKYVDEQGHEIANDEVISGTAGSKYTSEAKEIAGYELIEKPRNQTGILVADNKTIIYQNVRE